MGGRIRVFITSYQSKRNLAVLLELQDYSPVTLLKSIYGPDAISKATVLRDRNQTIALYVSPNPTSRFSSTLTAHGSGRWIHRDSTFDPGAYLLVTLPFPQRKAVDMKVKLQDNWLEFSIPESEKLYSNLALNAILPEKIMHLGVDKSAEIKNKDNEIYSKIRILHFKYFMSNNTYLAAAESHLTMEEELAEYMPIPLIQTQQQKQQQQQGYPGNIKEKQHSTDPVESGVVLSQVALNKNEQDSVKNNILGVNTGIDSLKSHHSEASGVLNQVRLDNNNQNLGKNNADILGKITRTDSKKSSGDPHIIHSEPAKKSDGMVGQIAQELVKNNVDILINQAIRTDSKVTLENKHAAVVSDTIPKTGGPSLEAFFSNEPSTGSSSNIVVDNDVKVTNNHEIKSLKGDTLTLAQATGLL